MDPAGVAPVEHHVSPRLDQLLQPGGHAVAHAVQFFIRLDHHGNLQASHALLDVAHAGAGKGHGLNLVDAQLVDEVRLIAQRTRENLQLYLAAGDIPPALPHPFQNLVPGGALGGESAHLDLDRLRAPGSQKPEHDGALYGSA